VSRDHIAILSRREGEGEESTNRACRDEFVIRATKIELDRRFRGFVTVFNQRRAPGAAIADDLLPH